MKSKASYFNISPALVLENLRRFWTIGVLGFLIYFLSGPFPVLMNYNDLANMASYIEASLENQQPFFLFADVAVPLIAALVLFRYLHNTASTTTMHTMPFTRSELYVSNLVSGIILVTFPILANGLIYHMIRKPVYAEYMYREYNIELELLPDAVDMFSHGAINNWIFSSLILAGVVYALSVLAGMLTGNLFLHILVAGGLNLLAIAFYGSLMLYVSTFFYGFSSEGAHSTILLTMNPFSKIFEDNGSFSTTVSIIYIALIFIALITSWFLYKKRAMEKAGEGIVYRFMIPILNFILAYFGMTLMGYYFASFLAPVTDDVIHMPFFCMGLALGAVLAFIIGRMILLGTPRIFNLSALKSFAVYGVIAVLFVSTFVFDFVGFESKVPKAKDIENVELYIMDIFYGTTLDGIYCFGKNIDMYKDLPEDQRDNGDFIFRAPENIEAIRNLHEGLTKSEEATRELLRSGSREYVISLNYNTNNPLGLQRSYVMSYEDVLKNPYLKQLYESKEIKDFFSLDNFDCESFKSVSLVNSYFDSEDLDGSFTVNIQDKAELEEFLTALEADRQDRTFEESIEMRHSYCDINLEYIRKDDEDRTYTDTIFFELLQSDSHTISWLEEKGYSSVLEVTADDVVEIEFRKCVDGMLVGSMEYEDMKKEMSTEQLVSSSTYPVDEEDYYDKVMITDKAQIAEILATAADDNINYHTYYEGIIFFKPIQTNYYEVVNSSTCVYYEIDLAPEYISQGFAE